jgi:putative spermidine/putrescine transport system substrate-binding protein
MLDALPAAAGYEKAHFPSLDEQGAGSEPIKTKWDAVVGANVQ